MGAVTSLFLRKMVAAAGDGVNASALLASVGLDPLSAPDPKTMVADTAYYDLLERMAKQIDVTDLPLRTGDSMRCDDYGALGLAFKAAPTLRGSFARVARYARVWTSVVSYELRAQGEQTAFLLHRAGQRRLGLRLSNEATLASAIAIARETSPGPVAPVKVMVQHAAPRSILAHRAFFGCDVAFGADHDGLLFANATLDRPNRLGDEGITRFLIGHLDDELRKLAQDRSVEEMTKDAIARALSDGPPKMDAVARRLGMSTRSLHRRLSEDGLSFQRVVERTRQELAEGLLRDDQYSIAEIAFLTGFSEQSAFSRAFKRWVGASPANFRRSAQAA